jgi:hypothetical protein
VYFGLSFGAISQCVPAGSQVSYHFGFRYKQMSTDPDALTCYIAYYAGTSCSGESINSTSVASGVVPAAGAWGSKGATFMTATGTGSIRVECKTTSLYDGWYDQIYLNASGYY